MKNSFLLYLMPFTLVIILSCSPTPSLDRPAVENLIDGWTRDVLYSNTCVSPVGMTPGEDGVMYINERCANRILKLSKDGTIYDWVATDNLSMNAIVYQPNSKRLIRIDGTALYTITPNATDAVGSFSDNLSASTIIADPRDDSLYAVSWKQNSTIRYYDSNFTLIKTIKNVDYCLNMALDPNEDILYYTESAAQTVSSYNLLSGATQIIKTNIGNGWNDENIGVAMVVQPQNS